MTPTNSTASNRTPQARGLLGDRSLVEMNMYETNEDVAFDLERECETWDWARTAGVSALDLRMHLLDSLGLGEAA
jgi:hypothetical protein